MQKLVLFCERYGIALVPFCLILLACGLWPEMELLVPSLPDMKQAFDIHDAEIQQLLTVNFVGFILGVLIAGPLCDSLGRKRVLVVGAIAYLLASFMSVFVSNFSFMMLARFLQGFTMTGPLIAGGVLLLEATAGAKQVFWMSLSNSAVTFCMAAAPIVGSWINNGFGFRGNLWSIIFLGFIGVVPALFFVSESLPPEQRKPFRPALLVKGYLTLLRDWRFMCLSVPMCALAAAYWVYVGVSALYMVDYLGIPAAQFGRYQGPIVGCFSVVSLIASHLMQRFGLLRCLKVGTAFMYLGCLLLFGMSVFSHDAALWTTLCMMLFVGGMAPVCSLLFPYSMMHLPPDLQGNAQAMVQAIRLLFASAGTFFLGIVYSGPLLCVTSVLLVYLLVSTLFLWFGRSFLKEKAGSTPLMGGH